MFKKGITSWNKGIPNSGFKRGYTPWNKGKKHSEEYKKMMSERMTGENNPYFGKKHTEEIKDKMRGENNGSWKGGITPENQLIRQSREYALWREVVFKRDEYFCQECGLKGGWNKELKIRVKLEVHHIKPFFLFPELRFAIDNGVTLCKSCHTKTPTYGINAKYLITQ